MDKETIFDTYIVSVLKYELPSYSTNSSEIEDNLEIQVCHFILIMIITILLLYIYHIIVL